MSNLKYTRKTLLDGEQILYAGRLHRFSLLAGAFFFCVGLFLLFPPDFFSSRMDDPMFDTFWYYVDWIKYYYEQFLFSLPEEYRALFLKFQSFRKNLLGLLLMVVGIFIFLTALIKIISVEPAITSRKVILKKGLVEVNETEIPLHHVEGAKIKQSALDRIINRGNILVTGIGMEHMEIKKLHNPNQFKQEVYKAIDLATRQHGQPTVGKGALPPAPQP